MRKLSLEEVHDILLNIAKEFHRICACHNIPYYMLGGTMLGAVRHKGFIPWDDDMDFGVPREHFNELKNSLEKELPSYYHLLTMDNNDSLILDFIKIEDTRTIMYEHIKGDTNYTFGLNIDIFPLDVCNGNKGYFSRNFMIRTLVRCQFFRFANARNRRGLKKAISYTLKITLPFLKRKTIVNYLEKHVATKGDHCVNIYGAWGFKEIIPLSTFESQQLYLFEDTQFYGPKDSDTYLTRLYGNYMQLPPEDKRRVHIEVAFWK